MEVLNTSKNIFINANAGSGKTKQLVDRFAALIFHNTPIDKIVCITYTVAATNEITSRILNFFILVSNDIKNHNIEKWSNFFKVDKDIIINKTEEILTNFEKLKIYTFHSFCLELLKLRQDFNTNFNILSSITDRQYKFLYSEVCKKIDFESASSSSIKNLIKTFGTKNIVFGDDNFIKFILKPGNLKYIQRIIDNKDSYLKILREYFDINHDLVRGDFFMDIEYINDIQDLLSHTGNKDIVQNINVFLNNKTIENLCLVFFTQSGGLRKYNEDRYEKIRQYSINLITKIVYQESFHSTESFLNFAEIIIDIYKSFKNKYDFLDYYDIIKHTKDSLKDLNFLLSVYNFCDHILLDEAQDLSQDQWEICDIMFNEFIQNFITKNKTFFIVGDKKQSIFSFQGADVLMYCNKVQEYIKKSQEFHIGYCDIELNTSYRSKAEIVNFINNFNNSTWARNSTNIDLVTHQNYHGGGGIVEVNESCDDILSDVINKIRALILSGVRENDVLILLRSRTALGNMYSKISNSLKQNGINILPDKSVDNDLERAILDIHNILKLSIGIINKYDFLCLLKSCIFNLPDEEILLYNASSVNLIIEKLPQDSLKLVEEIRMLSGAQNFSQFTVNLIKSDLLFNKLCDYHGENLILDILNFINDAARNDSLISSNIKIMDLNFSEIKLSVNANDGVRIMTIHGSKGLEAKHVLYIHDSRRTVASKEIDGKFIYLQPFWNIFIAKPSLLKYLENGVEDNKITSITLINKSLALAEEVRLAYVAITRPIDFLYIFSEDRINFID